MKKFDLISLQWSLICMGYEAYAVNIMKFKKPILCDNVMFQESLAVEQNFQAEPMNCAV